MSKRKEKETKEFLGKEIWGAYCEYNTYGAHISLRIVRGEEDFRIRLPTEILVDILRKTGLSFTAEKAVTHFYVKDYEFFAGG